MGEWLSGMSGIETMFLICAVVGGILFLCRLVLQLMGGDTEVADDLPDDIPDDVPDDVAAADADIGDSDVSFRLISIQGIMAFLMIFGLVGLAVKQSTSGSDAQAIILASAGGLGVMVLQWKLMVYLLKLQSSGTLKIANAVGAEGTVYLTIPAGGTGQVRVIVQDQMRVFDATSADRTEIPTGEGIRVVSVASGSILVVKRAAAAS